jgi:hypothetical protein
MQARKDWPFEAQSQYLVLNSTAIERKNLHSLVSGLGRLPLKETHPSTQMAAPQAQVAGYLLG